MNWVGFIKNLTDGEMGHLVTKEGRLSFGIPMGHIYEMIADGGLPFKEYREGELNELIVSNIPESTIVTNVNVEDGYSEGYWVDEGDKEYHSVGKIVEILHSIKRLEMDKELEVWFEGSESCEIVTSFIPGSFTRELLELIERHLVEGSER